jgi:WD40 repeat protein
MGTFRGGDRRGRGPFLAWRRWQLGLAAAGILAGVVAMSGDLETGAGAAGGPTTPIAREELGTPVWSLARGGDSLLASITTHGDVWLKDVITGRTIRLRDACGEFTYSMAAAPDGHTLAVAAGKAEVRLWDAARGVELEPLRDGEEMPIALAFSPDATILAAGKEIQRGARGRFTLWEWPSRRRIADVECHPAGIHGLAFTPDGSSLITTDRSGELAIWDVAARRPRARFRAHAASVTARACSPDGRLIATASYFDGSARLWDATTGEPRRTLPDTSIAVTAMAFAPGGAMLAIARGDGVASLREVATGREVWSARASDGRLQSITFAGDGPTLATGGVDGAVQLWDVARVVATEPARR